MSKQKHYTILTLLFLVTVYGLYSSVVRGNASAWFYEVEFDIQNWSQAGKIEDEAHYQQTLAKVMKVHALDPGHPHYTYMVGQVMHWGVEFGYEDDVQLLVIKDWYLKSANQRPLWPEPWIDLASLNNYLDGYNQETQYYLQQALKVGPYYQTVTTGVISVLLKNWDDLSAKDKTLLYEQFAIAAKQPVILEEALTLAKEMEKENLLCVQIKFKPEYEELKDSAAYRKLCLKKS